MKLNKFHPLMMVILLKLLGFCSVHAETLPPIVDGKVPQTQSELWADFDPRAEPLDVEVLHAWEEDGVQLQVVRFRVGVFKGEKAMVAAVYGYPKGAKNLPGLVNIHGGGQYADYRAPLANAKRGYATISIAWAGRINAPDYRVTPDEVKLFWSGKTEDPNYKLTTDWGALDGYHAPNRYDHNTYSSDESAEWTLDPVPSPRNSSWFLSTLAARRALTFLEQQPEVDAERLGVYGHSMGGKLTVLTAGSDARVKAAAPSCGGISDLHDGAVADGPSLEKISCPIIFLSPSNDFHGRIADLPTAIEAIQTDAWRITSSPHHNHQDTAEYEAATLLWMDQHLKDAFRFPETPEMRLRLRTASGVPSATLEVDRSKPIQSVDVYYTQQGQVDGAKSGRSNTRNRFWHHVSPQEEGGESVVDLPLISTEDPLWAYVNVTYALEEPVSSAGYYYGVRSSDTYVISSLVHLISPKELHAAEAKATLEPMLVIEKFEGDWEKEWFSYHEGWARSTHKLNDPQWQAPPGAKLVLHLSAAEANTLIVRVDNHAAEVALEGGAVPQAIELAASDFKDAEGGHLSDLSGIKELRLSASDKLRRKDRTKQTLGGDWSGPDPVFSHLHWVVAGDGSSN